MRYLFYLLMACMASLYSCRERVDVDLCLDDLHDRQEITGGIVVDCSRFNNHEVERVLLNGVEFDKGSFLDLSESGFYRIEVILAGSGYGDSEVIRVVILDKERGEAEWGLKKWTPKAASREVIDGSEITLIFPPASPPEVNVPLVVMIGEEMNKSASNLTASAGPDNFRIKRGTGSVQIPPGDRTVLSLNIDGRSLPLATRPIGDESIILQGELSEDIHIPGGSLVKVGADLVLPGGLTLTIDSGSFVLIDPMVNIHIDGNLLIRGSAEEPVTMTCSDPAGLWGGIIGKSPGNRVDASYAVFCQSGFHTGDMYDYGHARRQALFYSENGTLFLDHCYMIDHAGQVFYTVSSSLDLRYSLVQRAKTGGQINSSLLNIQSCIFTDFPDDSYTYRDEDNDCLYLNGSDAVINNSLFMYARDDGLDSGGSEGGNVRVSGTRFEAVFHEGAALSSGGTATKSHIFTRCTFTNCGQGLELGYSSFNHHVTVDSCLFYENGTGIRYGDNYVSQHLGMISVSNSESINNADRDIWNMVRESWSADTLKMQFSNVRVSRKVPMYPQLKIYE